MATYPGQFMMQFFDASGNPLALGKIYSYLAGGSTPAVTYTDQAAGTQNTNPVVCDSAGRCAIWLPADTAYKLVVKTSADVTLQTIDYVYGMPSFGAGITTTNFTATGNVVLGDNSGDTLAIRPNAVTWTNNPTHSGDHTFSGALTFLGAVNGMSAGRLPLAGTSGVLTSSATFSFTDTSSQRAMTVGGSGSTSAVATVINTHASGFAALFAQTTGSGDAYVQLTSSTGDAYTKMNVGGFDTWYVGMDNSSSDRFVIGTDLPGAADHVQISTAGVTTVCASTATPAAGSTSARLLFGTTAGFGIYYGSNAPTVSAAQGSLYLRSNGSSTTTRAYINTDGGTTWTAISTVA